MNRIFMTILAVATVILIAAGWQINRQFTQVAELEASNKRLQTQLSTIADGLAATKTVLRKRETAYNLQAQKLQSAQQELQGALQANKDWSATDVPPDVQKALSGLSGPVAGGLQDD